MSRLADSTEKYLLVYLERSERLIELLSQGFFEEAWVFAPWQRSAFHTFSSSFESATIEEQNIVKNKYKALQSRLDAVQELLPSLWDRYAQSIKSQQAKIQQEKDRIQKFKTNLAIDKSSFETSV